MIDESLETPDKVRELQIKLYRKAKSEPEFRFYLLYDKMYRTDVLLRAWRLAKANDGAPGVDGQRFEDIESEGVMEWLNGRGKDLRERSYRASPVRRVMIEKENGGERPLGIPTIRDRVAQTAAKLILEPILEADLEPCAYGYRPKRSAGDAKGKKKLTGGKDNDRGTPQGGVISPLLANLYMNRMLKGWKQTGRGVKYRARIVNYADDFVILSRGKAAESLEWVGGVVARLKLTLHEKKTSIRDARRERFDFLGYQFGPHYSERTGRKHMGCSPSKRSMNRIRKKVSEYLGPSNTAPWDEVRDRLNQKRRGWKAYFGLGNRWKAYGNLDEHVQERVRHFLRRRHKVSSQGTRQFSRQMIFGELGVLRLAGRSGAGRP